MKKAIAVTLLSLALFGSVQAQIRKCTATDGKITYSNAPCKASSKSTQYLDIPTSGADHSSVVAPPSTASVYEREINAKIAAYLAQPDFDSATTLAVTAEHFKMIADARREHRSNQSAAQAEFIPNQYECERTTRNAEVAAKIATRNIRNSVLDREMNTACFGPERAAQIEEARAGAPNVTVIKRVAPNRR